MKYLLVLYFVLGFVGFGISQNNKAEPIPEREKNRTSPILFEKKTQKEGEVIYMANCRSCHGDPGKANYAKLDPLPVDPASAKYQANTDGEIFYILTRGKGLMPVFANILTEEQRWVVLSYIRSFNPLYVQPPVSMENNFGLGRTTQIDVKWDAPTNKLIISVLDTANGKKVPVSNSPIQIAVKRSFGNLELAEVFTDENGIAYLSKPENISGDNKGNVNIVAKLKTSDGNSIQTELSAPIGKISAYYKLTDQRAWWNVNQKAPLWLVFSYFSALTGILTFLIYIAVQLKKIVLINKNKPTEYEKNDL